MEFNWSEWYAIPDSENSTLELDDWVHFYIVRKDYHDRFGCVDGNVRIAPEGYENAAEGCIHCNHTVADKNEQECIEELKNMGFEIKWE